MHTADTPLAGIKNIIVLTHGWTGSSVFSGLLGQAGFWLGADTVAKPDYNTHENADLVSHNNRLLHLLSPSLNHEHRFDPGDVQDIAARARTLDLAPYREFVASCNEHRPWVWKDPRLTWTIRVWAEVLDLQQTAFLVLTRDPLQAWVSANQRRHIQSQRFTREYNGGITASNLQFLQERQLPFLQLSFEDLLLQPEATLERMNQAYGLALTMQALQAVCHIPLYRKSRRWNDVVHASLIYLKNYAERDGRGRRSPPAQAGRGAMSGR